MNFFNLNPCIPSRPGVFQFDIFCIILYKSMCICAFGPSSSLSSSFIVLLIHSAFLLFSWLPYFTPKLFSFSCIWLLVCFCVISPNLEVEFSFVVLECSTLYCFTLCLYLFNVPSFASTFWFISSNCIVIFFCLAFFFLSQLVSAFFLCFIIFAYFRSFIYLFPVEFPIQILIFWSYSLREPRFSHKLIFLLHKLVHLIWLCFFLVYMLVLDLFFCFRLYCTPF